MAVCTTLGQLTKQTAPQLASSAWRQLNGLFAVYKPRDVVPKRVRSVIQTALIEDLNRLQQRPQRSHVKIVRDLARLDEDPNALIAVEELSLTDDPLVRGQLYSDIKLAVASGAHDMGSSGVMVFAIKGGTRKIETYHAARMPRRYTVQGRFGIATDSHDEQGKIWQKSTYHHVTREKFDRVLSNLQRSHQKIMYSNAGVDMGSQEAYELAARGMLRPFGPDVPALLLNIGCTHFEPPHFELEIECIRETAQFLRKTIHDLAQEMKTCAIATHVRRTQDGPFKLEHALLRRHWNLVDITEALRASRELMKLIDVDKRAISKILDGAR